VQARTHITEPDKYSGAVSLPCLDVVRMSKIRKRKVEELLKEAENEWGHLLPVARNMACNLLLNLLL